MGKRVLGGLLEYVFGLTTTLFSVVCCFSFLAFYIHPSRGVFFQWLSLFLPILLLLNLGLLLYWIVRRKKFFLFPLLALIANFWYYPAVFNLQLNDTSGKSSENTIVVATYNVNSFQTRTKASSLSDISDLVNNNQVDIFCVQEVPLNISKDSLLSSFPLFRYMAVSDSIEDGFGIAILSKFPIINFEFASFYERSNCVLRADLDVFGKTISVFNCHLQTTNWNQRKSSQLGKGVDSVIKQKTIMDSNFILRAQQADTINEMIRKLEYPVIVCGDFNDTPASYVYHRIKQGLNDSFHSSGNYYSYTYRYMCKLLRIDYLFYSPDMFNARRYESPNISYSDHNPVIVTLELKD